jgi:hypothetical protein
LDADTIVRHLRMTQAKQAYAKRLHRLRSQQKP